MLVVLSTMLHRLLGTLYHMTYEQLIHLATSELCCVLIYIDWRSVTDHVISRSHDSSVTRRHMERHQNINNNNNTTIANDSCSQRARAAVLKTLRAYLMLYPAMTQWP